MVSPAQSKTIAKHFQAFTCLEVEDAAESPGVYAWYARIEPAEPDWKLELVDGEDVGRKNCRSLLQRFTSRFTRAALQLEGRGHFSTVWRGDLHDVTTERLRATLAGEAVSQEGDDEAQHHAKLEAILLEPHLRRILLQALHIATPIISAPIYIGVAAKLRERLKQHVEAIYKLSHVAPPTPEERNLLLRDKRFGARAVGMGFSPDTLVVWTLNLGDAFPEGDSEKLRAVAECAEWLLNRWHRPFLGRR